MPTGWTHEDMYTPVMTMETDISDGINAMNIGVFLFAVHTNV